MLDHIAFEVTSLPISAAFYDALFSRLGIRRVEETAAAIAYGRHEARFWIVARGREPGPSYGHVAIEAAGRPAVEAAYAAGLEHGGQDAGAPGPRPQYGQRYFAAYLLDPDGLRVEVVSGSS